MLAVMVLIATALSGQSPHPDRLAAREAHSTYRNLSQLVGLTIEYPLDGSVFPPEIVSPAFRWKDDCSDCDSWLIRVEFGDVGEDARFIVRSSHWRPSPEDWEKIKTRSTDKPARITIFGFDQDSPDAAITGARISITTSSDEVGAPIFYREVNLPFVDAVRDPSTVRWRFGDISSESIPPVVLDNLPVCGNCHSFSAKGDVLGMDIDYANNKGSYAIESVEQHMVIDKSRIITWSDYKPDQNEVTYGLLSQVSPDGRYVVSTVKDESVFVPKPGLDFSQLFFPVKGILCIYDREKGTFSALPGADDPYLVQSNPSWSPDGKYIVFAATEAYKLKRKGPRKLLLSGDECLEFLEEGKPFKFDLYRIPFSEGKGGKAEPLEGGSFNGKSNFFARYSPDGKWIVFCQAENYMLLQPDSELYIIPADGGEARRLAANTKRMNSWHSFSPNGRWLVFSSKPDGPYTQLFLTHIDEVGRSTPAIVLDRFTSPDRAANIPEFVNASSSAIVDIREKFVDDHSFVRAGREFMKAQDYENAERQCRKALELNAENIDAHFYLGLALFHSGRTSDAAIEWSEVVTRDPNNVEAYYNLGQIMLRRHKTDDAISYFSKVIKLKPDHIKGLSNLGGLLFAEGKANEAVIHLSKAIRLDPNNIDIRYNLAHATFVSHRPKEAIRHFSIVVDAMPDDPAVHSLLATALAHEQRTDEAVEHWLKAIELDPNDVESRYNVGRAMAVRGKFDEAVEYWSPAIRLSPKHIQVRYNLAVALAKLGKYQEAISHWREFLEREPGNPGALMNVAACYFESGQIDRALVSLNLALETARAASNEELEKQITEQIKLYRQNGASGIVPAGIEADRKE